MNTDQIELEFAVGQLDASYYHGYYLSAEDIKRIVLFVYRASEYGIDKNDFIELVKKSILNKEIINYG